MPAEAWEAPAAESELPPRPPWRGPRRPMRQPEHHKFNLGLTNSSGVRRVGEEI
ncbi:MAG: hypothetical protein GY772_01385 [bacterium]|nr:hypothetical protein [bacterium]